MCFGVLGRPVEDAAVAAVRHLPVEHQLEVAELFLGDQVAGLLDPDQRPVLRLPAGRDVLLLVAPPALRGGAVEQELPAVGLLLLGQGVGRRLGHRLAELGGNLLDRPEPDVPEEDLGPFRLKLDAAAGDRLRLAVHLPADVREHEVDGAVDDVDAGLADADQVELVPLAARLLVVVAVEDAELRADVLLAAGPVPDRLVRVAALLLGDVLALDIDDDPLAVLYRGRSRSRPSRPLRGCRTRPTRSSRWPGCSGRTRGTAGRCRAARSPAGRTASRPT